jgi:hypothetical protein
MARWTGLPVAGVVAAAFEAPEPVVAALELEVELEVEPQAATPTITATAAAHKAPARNGE